MPELFAVGRRQIEAEELAELELLEKLSPLELATLSREAVPLVVTEGQLVCLEGEPADGFYLVMSGSFVAFRDALGQPVHLLTHLQRGDFFGELGLVTAGHYFASVRASERSEMLRIGSELLAGILKRHPALLERIQATNSARYSHLLASALELGRRREVRIKCSEAVELDLSDGRTLPALLENLSIGGACFAEVPASWLQDSKITFGLRLRKNVLPLAGTITWRMGGKAGIAFTPLDHRHDARIQMVLHLLLHDRSG